MWTYKEKKNKIIVNCEVIGTIGALLHWPLRAVVRVYIVEIFSKLIVVKYYFVS